MKTTIRAASSVFLIIVMGLGISGCATYNYTQQKDSAIVSGTQPLFSMGQWAIVMSIDGASLGARWSPASPQFVSPSDHELVIETAIQGLAETPVEATFAANHVYNFSIIGGYIALSDVTRGPNNPASAGRWEIAEGDFSDSEPITQVNFSGAQHARPPLDGRDHEQHSGGPPSIPHNPRPSPGGGRGRGGGGHTGGGGGGHKR